MDEKTLAERLAGGDAEALGRIIELYSGYVHTVAFNFSRGALTPEDIEELTLDVFYSIWEHRENIKAETGLRSYLSASVRNNVKNRLRQHKPGTVDISELEIASGFSVESAAELNEMTSCLYEALTKLPERDRALFIRFYIYGESSSQLAERMDTSSGAILTRIYRIRNKLKKQLKKRGYDHV